MNNDDQLLRISYDAENGKWKAEVDNYWSLKKSREWELTEALEKAVNILARIVEIEDQNGMGVIGWSDVMDDAREAVKKYQSTEAEQEHFMTKKIESGEVEL